MSWADRAIKLLADGESATIKPHGGSMKPKVESGATVTLEPVDISELSRGDIGLCKVKGNVYLHLVKAIDNGRVQIGNNKGRINGWTRTVFGRAVKIMNP
jgi:hypothetical protein